MKKILVTTDLSANSKSALFFAIQLASQHDYRLTFFYSLALMKPTSWNEKVFQSFENSELEKVERKLDRFVKSAYARKGIKPIHYECIVTTSLFPEKNIIEYAKNQSFDLICASRRGVGLRKSIFGTVASGLINKSPVPVIAVPPNYRTGKIEKVLYASDLLNLEKELRKVVEITDPLKVTLELLHFKMLSDLKQARNLIGKAGKALAVHNVKLNLPDFNFTESIVKNLDREITRSKPSLVIMFTEQNRDFFEKLFLPGSTEAYAFKARVPLLVFHKQPNQKTRRT